MQKSGSTMASVGRDEREEELALFHEVLRREHERKSSAIHPLPPHDADQLHSGSVNASLWHQMASSPAKMTLTSANNKLVVDNSQTIDLNLKNDDLLTAELGKNDYDWLLTPPGTPLRNHSKLNSASEDDSLSQLESFSLVQSLAAIKTSRFSSNQAEVNSRKQGATLLTDPELAYRKGHNGASRSNGLLGNSMYSTTNVTTSAPKKTPLTLRSGSALRPASPSRRTPISSAHIINPTTPKSKAKPLSAPGSHPTTPTSRHTAAVASKGGGNFVLSSSVTTKKTSPSSPAATSAKRLSPLHAQNQPVSAGVSRSSSFSKARPQPSRSAPSSRGNSPRGASHDWQQAFSSKPQSVTTAPILRSNHSTLTSFNTRSSQMGNSHRQGATTSTKQALFSSLDHLETSMDIPKRASSTSLTRGKSALQSSAGSILSRYSIQLDKSEGDSVMENTEVGGQARRYLGSSISPDTTCSRLEVDHSSETYMSPTLGFNKHVPRRSLDMAMLNLSLCRDATNGHSSLVSSKRELSSLSSAGNDQTEILSSLVKDDNKSNWLGSPEYMNEGPDPMMFFEQGLGKFGSCESPLVCPHGGGAVTCDLCNVKMRLQMLNEKSKASFGAYSQILSEA
ncbi:hypothetical protein GOP47_0013499 [Adiantum capillus-veneris]|uniref:Uncharacterized protein n=1 Tax=Adiantum capillus-veneris TaxID=13818 RepID=A0A9D4UNM6_ADICA|nr:hypothetical protein GOP47_0013499 [Adiantum capillus-veneris]